MYKLDLVRVQKLDGCWDGLVGIVTRPQAGQPNNHGSITDRGKRLPSSP
jgi:hypothetical protein